MILVTIIAFVEKELRELKPAEVQFVRDSLHFSQGNGGADVSYTIFLVLYVA